MDLMAALTALGFTEYEAKVYLALLREHPATGYQLGKQAGIPRSMVYEALGRLHARGAALKTEEQGGSLYRPLPPEMLLSRYEQEQARLVQTLRDGLSALYTARDEDRLWSISGRTSVLAYAAQMLQRATSEVLLVLDDPDLEALRAEIVQVCGRGLDVSTLLTGSATLDCGQVARHPPLESQLQGLTGMLVVVVDRDEALIASADAEMSATITSNRNLVLIARQFVWMELFTQRISARLGADLLDRLDPEDRKIFDPASGGSE
ncbi:MAG TPA: helix-turn-helix domain-containing protein [Roseiflexaceae bacterium]|nr:helix-turn-helix domain-containing protein [Roseiflexaceae bacterium]